MPFSSPGIAIALSSGLPFPDPGTELPSTYVINTSIALALCQALYYTSHGNSNQAFSMCPFTRGENGGPGWLRACWVAGSRGGACTWPWSRWRATSVPVVCVCLLATSLSDTRAWAPQILTMGLLCTFRIKVQNTGSSCYKVSQGPVCVCVSVCGGAVGIGNGECVCMCVCLCVCLSLCLSVRALPSDPSVNPEVAL